MLINELINQLIYSFICVSITLKCLAFSTKKTWIWMAGYILILQVSISVIMRTAFSNDSTERFILIHLNSPSIVHLSFPIFSIINTMTEASDYCQVLSRCYCDATAISLTRGYAGDGRKLTMDIDEFR